MIGSGYERRSETSSSGHEDAAAAPRVRVYEMAKELGLANRDLVGKIRALGIDVANHMSHIEAADVDRIRRALDRERQESLVEERLTDTVIRRRSKSAPPLPPRSAPASSAAAPSAPVPSATAPVVRARAPEPVPAAAPAVSEPPPPPPAPPVEATAAPAPASSAEPAEPAIPAEPVQRRRVVEAPNAAAAARPAPVMPPAPAAEPAAPAIAARRVESERVVAPAMSAAAPATPAQPQVTIRTITSPVVTGSAATGAFIQLPGMPPRGEAGVPKIEIKDRDEELRRLGRTGLINRQPAGRDRYGRPAFGAPGQRPGAPPRKKVAAAGKKIKKTEITTPAEHKRVVRMDETIAVSDLAQKMGIKGKRSSRSSGRSA